MRLNRYIARSGITSRRKAEELIASGRILVNGSVCKELATEIREEDEVTLDNKLIEPSALKYFLFNKPTGYATTKSDPFEHHVIFELLPKDDSLFAVGRLDRNTSGLIFITNDGDFAQNIIHPAKKIEKEYVVRTKFPVEEDQIQLLKKGLELEDGLAMAKEAKRISAKELSITIEMGRNRIVRRMIKAIGNEVAGLNRVRIGKIALDVPVGQYRELTNKEVGLYA